MDCKVFVPWGLYENFIAAFSFSTFGNIFVMCDYQFCRRGALKRHHCLEAEVEKCFSHKVFFLVGGSRVER